ncbi:MAG: 3-phosphoshikimate 1-carboxyvinyltransferase [Candidatus Omnitrophica bacterium]|nr:3-phosphoshikimate 1-carboxyvinyltransferase [Candidatus Omnitrophota bacterium]MCG2704119.1 3-phosphoshikimate 1-carboxyvinyltransferase [Candidatus Omnitrophota bacterium]
MPNIKTAKIRGINGEFFAPADKSISQRAVIIAALAKGRTRFDNFLDCADCRRAMAAFRQMGVDIRLEKKNRQAELYVQGKGLFGLSAPKKEMDIGNSGTTMRLVCGILAGQPFESKLSGDASLSKRPMKRVIEPLRSMGAVIKGRLKDGQEYPPLTIKGMPLQGISYNMPIKSAQVKSCVLLAGLLAEGRTEVLEMVKTRDHTERMLKAFQADIRIKGRRVCVRGKKELCAPRRLFIPGDMSSCAFFIIAAALAPKSRLRIKNAGLNPTRIALLSILKRMGVEVNVIKNKNSLESFEPYADISVKSSRLKAVTLTENDVAYCIDELPILCVAACFAEGTTRILGAAELRVKETDRIHAMVTNLKKAGADIRNVRNDLIIKGTGALHGTTVDSFGDHRTAMSMAVAGLMAEGEMVIRNTECVNKSFPEFMNIMRSIIN